MQKSLKCKFCLITIIITSKNYNSFHHCKKFLLSLKCYQNPKHVYVVCISNVLTSIIFYIPAQFTIVCLPILQPLTNCKI